MEKKQNKFKEFVKKHKDEIVIGATIAGGCILTGVLSCAVGYRAGRSSVETVHETILDVVRDAKNKGYSPATIAWRKNPTPLNVSDLGKLGEEFKAMPGYDERMTFTHFIAIGDDYNKTT